MDPITAFLINLLIGVVLSLASTLISSIFKQDQKQKVAGVRGTIQTGGDNSPSFIVGRYATAGKLKYAGTWGNDGETPNAFYSKVVEVSFLPIRGYSGWFINGERVTLAASVTTTLGYAVLEYRDDNGKDHAWINPYLGAQTVADPLMRAKFGADADRPYTSTMVGRGLGYFVATFRVNRELFSGLPEVLAEVDGIELDDPRGDDEHDNPIVAAYTLLKGLSYDGEWVYGPQTYTDYNFRLANIESEADKCDAARSLSGGGTEKRFRIGLEVSLDAEPHAIVGEFLKGCQGRWADVGGVFKFLVGDPGSPVVSITDEDIVITEQQTFDPFPGLESLFNAMTATYPEPAEAWETKEAPPRYRSDLEASDDGRRLPFSTDYKAVPYAVQVQELMRSAIEETRRFRRHTMTMPPEWWEYEVLDVASWSSLRNGYENKQFLITAMDDLPNVNQFVGVQEIDPDDYDWDSDYELPYDVVPLVIARPTPQEITGFAVEPYTGEDNNSVPRRPGFRIFGYGEGLVDVQSVLVQARLDSDDKLVIDGRAPYDPDEIDPSAQWAGDPLLPDTDYEVRGKLDPFSGRKTEWSAWLTVTTPDVRLTSLDVQLDDLAEEIEADTIAKLDWAVYNTRETIEEKRKAILLNVAGAAGDFMDRQTIRREASSTYQTSKAQWSEDILVATGPSSALSLRLEELGALVEDPETGLAVTVDIVSLLSAEINDTETGLEAIGNSILSITSSVPGASATGLLRIYTAATESGAQSTIALTTAASAIGDARTAALFLSSISDGTSGVSVVADRFSVKTSPVGTKYGIFVIDSGVVWIDEARIRNLDAANIDVVALTGSSGFFDLFEATWAQIETAVVTNFVAESANIGTLTIGTLNIIGDAIADDVEDTLTGSATSAETKIVYSTTWVGTGKLTPIFVKMAATVSGAGTGPMIYVVNLQNVTDGTLTPFLSGAPDYLQSHIFSGTGIVKTISGKTYRLKLQGEYQPNDHAWTYVWDAAVISRKR